MLGDEIDVSSLNICQNLYLARNLRFRREMVLSARIFHFPRQIILRGKIDFVTKHYGVCRRNEYFLAKSISRLVFGEEFTFFSLKGTFGELYMFSS